MVDGWWRLDGQVAVVTGASRGIGRAVALALAGAGADVVCAARSRDELAETARGIAALGRRALVHILDVTRADDVAQMAEAAYAWQQRVDILVNNSGVLLTRPLLETSDDDWYRVMRTNLDGAFFCTRAIGRYLVAGGGGKVINVGSAFAAMGVPNHAAYCASKAALAAFTRSLAVEWARHNVQVNAIAPGYFDTDIPAAAMAQPALKDAILRGIPARRVGDPDELGPLVVYLASPSASYMTGEIITIDGGMAIK